jgi:hypothetical protein
LALSIQFALTQEGIVIEGFHFHPEAAMQGANMQSKDEAE